ncbi:UDP-N-acetylmuramoyl-L-alanyl-D-glutamate--2,6-diaminopimelate ligase [Gammaproteobacteria bacterium]|nr:UDP-N-acetylmuramoyl-L-alanyl-D-glutamate--2,6-diaminopimelate ligase [Gammaproteobacteria bacterium]
MLEIRGCYHIQLSDLLNQVGCLSDEEVIISGLVSQLKEIQSGDAWVKYRPTKEEIQQAIKQQVSAIVCAEYPDGEFNIPIIRLENWQSSVGRLMQAFYLDPSSHMQMIGVTGTNGKTTVAYLIARAIQSLQKQSGYIGTIGYGKPGQLKKQQFTTPHNVDLNRYLADLRDQDVEYIALEASSHGLVQGRLSHVAIDIAVFTNLTHEHMDYHQSINDYLSAKHLLFKIPSVASSVINIDDPSGEYLAKHLKGVVWACSLKGFPRGYQKSSFGQIEAAGLDGITLTIITHQTRIKLHSKLIGDFNAYNLLLAHAALCSAGFDPEKSATALGSVSMIPGRMVPLSYEGIQPMIFVDFAHTPDAFEQVLTVLRKQAKSKLWVVFGCGGDRDPQKRPRMGAIAERLTDVVCITSDNNRSERFAGISQDILSGMRCPHLSQLYPCRFAAIEHAILSAKSGDIVLIAGMGDEKSYIVSSQSYMSDIEIIESIVYA